MKRISRYTFSIFILISISGFGQDSLSAIRFNSAGIYIDLATFASRFGKPAINQYSLLADLRFNDNYLVSVEGGTQNYNINRSNFNYNLQGWYGKLGIGKNIIRPPDNDTTSNAFIMIRYCFSAFRQNATDIKLVNSYWNNDLYSTSEENLTKHWLELGGGINVEIVRNFYLGWAFYIHIALNKTSKEIITPEIIPGYGNGFNSLNASFHYYLAYRIRM